MDTFDRQRTKIVGAALLLLLIALSAPSIVRPAQAQATDDLTRIKQQAKYRKEIRRLLRSDDLDEALAAFDLAIEHKSPAFRRMALREAMGSKHSGMVTKGIRHLLSQNRSFIVAPILPSRATKVQDRLYTLHKGWIFTPKLDRNTGAITTNKRYHKGQIVPGGFVFVYSTDRNVVGEKARCELRMAASSVSELKGTITCILHDRDIKKSGVRRASIPVRMELD